MATENRRENDALIQRLFSEPYRFDFFQAVCVLDRHYRWGDTRADTAMLRELGKDARPDQELVRFRSVPAVGFPASSIREVKAELREDPGPLGGLGEVRFPAAMYVNFIGLTGTLGVLPDEYTDLIRERLREKDYALHEFLELFHHRLVSLFYRAGQKYRHAAGYEHAKLTHSGEDRITTFLLSLMGLGLNSFHSHPERNAGLLSYLGHFTDQGRPNAGLQDVLADCLTVSVVLEQFMGRWLQLENDDLSRLPSTSSPEGAYARLGESFVAGTRCWDVQGKFRLALGPMDRAKFEQLLPGGELNERLVRMTRLYVGADLDFDVQLTLRTDHIQPWRLGTGTEPPARLGWSTWLGASSREDYQQHVLFSPHDLALEVQSAVRRTAA